MVAVAAVVVVVVAAVAAVLVAAVVEAEDVADEAESNVKINIKKHDLQYKPPSEICLISISNSTSGRATNKSVLNNERS